MKMDKLILPFKQVYLFFDNKFIFYIFKMIHSFTGRGIRKRVDRYNQGHADQSHEDWDWKRQTIEDFKIWLSQVESLSNPKAGETLNECDLFTLLAEFVSLKKQIQIQNREQSRNIRSLKDFNEFAQQGYAMISLLDEKINKLDTMEEKIKENAKVEALKAFLDVRDPLVRGVDSGKKIRFSYFIFGKKRLNSIMKGYEMALKKFDLALAKLETLPIDTKDTQFDPGTMMAVDTRHNASAEKGIVISEICGGFIRKNKVVRPAQVTVNK